MLFFSFRSPLTAAVARHNVVVSHFRSLGPLQKGKDSLFLSAVQNREVAVSLLFFILVVCTFNPTRTPSSTEEEKEPTKGETLIGAP